MNPNNTCIFTGRYVPSLASTPPPYVQYETSTSEHDWYISLYPDQAHTPSTNTIDAFNPPSMLPIPPEEDFDQDHIDIGIMDAGGGGGGSSNSNSGSSSNNNNENINVIKDYDTKWNEGEDVEEEEEEEHNPIDYPDIVEKQMPSTMVLVIGIIVGAFVAMILIVIIVLKIRVRVDQPKCETEAAPRYQFAPPNDYGEVGGEQETATTSLMEGSVAPPLVSLPPTASANAAGVSGGPPGVGVPGPGGVGGPAALSGVGAGLYNNGMFNNNCASRPLQPPPPSSNGDRSRLFRKSNGSKPVREWYV